MKNTFYVSCPIDTLSGYGFRSRDICKALIELDKYDVKIIPQRWGSTPWGFIEDNIEEWGFLREYIHLGPINEQPDIWLQHTVPNEFQAIGKFNIGLTAGIETTVCAHQWIEGCNRMNLVLVSSKHAKDVFETTKYNIQNQQTGFQGVLELTTPIKILMEGINTDLYKPINDFKNKELYKDLKSIPEDFAYLFVGHWLQGDLGEDRKNIGLLIKAFYETFKNKKKVPALILKTNHANCSNLDRRKTQEKLHTIRKSISGWRMPNVYLLHGEFTDGEMNELYNHPKVKAMVNLTKGEGYGRPLLEFSLINKPIITSGWSGHLDFLKPDLSALLPGKLTPVHPSAQVKDIIIENSQWFSVDIDAVNYALTLIYENYKDWKAKANKQGKFSKENFSYEKMKEDLKEILDGSIPELPKQIPLHLPKLKKLELPKIKLPKLRKIETE